MKDILRVARDMEVKRLFRDNVRQAEIGRRLGLKTPRVYAILVREGLIEPEKRGEAPDRHDSVWGKKPDELRRRFYERQRAGARAALEGMQ